MTKTKSRKGRGINLSLILPACFLLLIIYSLGSVIIPNYQTYFTPYYTDRVYQNLEKVFNASQYRQREPTAIIPDESVFSYAAGAYLHGVDPILINSETTPLGKYLIALSIYFLKNDKFVAIPFSLLTLFSMWLLSRSFIKNLLLSLVPVVIFSYEKLFINQLKTVPMLDIIQLPFIFLTLYFFIIEYKKQRFLLTAIFLGLVMATKTIVPAVLLISCFCLFSIIYKKIKIFIKLSLYLPISLIILTASYIRTFLNGYNFADFIGFQKWTLLYEQNKLLFPFSAWRLVFLNQWQAWWGDMSILKADDWQITWPIFTTLSFIYGIALIRRKIDPTPAQSVLFIWIFIFGVFLSIGVIASRYLLPFLPVIYIIGVHFLEIIYLRNIKMIKLIKKK